MSAHLGWFLRRSLLCPRGGWLTATGTGTRVGVTRVGAEWLGWYDDVLKYLRCTGAIPSHRCAYGAPSARRHRCPWHRIAMGSASPCWTRAKRLLPRIRVSELLVPGDAWVGRRGIGETDCRRGVLPVQSRTSPTTARLRPGTKSRTVPPPGQERAVGCRLSWRSGWDGAMPS